MHLFTEGIADDITLAIAGDDHLVAVGIFKGIDDGEAAVGLHIGFRAFAFGFNNFADGMLAAAAGIDGFDADFIFVHAGSAFRIVENIIACLRKKSKRFATEISLAIMRHSAIMKRNVEGESP